MAIIRISKSVGRASHEDIDSIRTRNDNRYVAMQKKNFQSDDIIKMIQEGYLHLVDLRVTSNPFSTDADEPPYSIQAQFCHLEFAKHKTDPAAVPMFKDLQAQSPACKSTRVQVDLYTAATAAKQYDKSHEGVSIRAMTPNGFVFHESRCGSTLVANSLVAFEPSQTRVYSESGPPISAAKLFNMDYEIQSKALLRDVIYLMGRTDDLKEENLFFKIQSIGSKSIWAFRKAFPTTPWLYVYRDPVQVMKSHLKVEGTNKAVCLRSQHHPTHDIFTLTKNISGRKPDELSNEEFCAAHLATLCEAAEKELLDSDGLGKVINYQDIPKVLIDDIIPHHFLGKADGLSPEQVQRILKVNEKYSKGRHTNKEWKDDSKLKEETAWPEMKDASKLFLTPVYDRLEKMKTQ